MDTASLDWRRARRAGALPEPEGSAARAAIRVKCVTTEAAFASLAVDWNRLHEQTASASVFNSWMWQYQWWTVYGRGQPLRVLVATQGDATVGILALYVQTERALGRTVRVLRAVGTGADTNPDDLGPVLAAGLEREAARALARAAARLPDGDLLLVSDIDPDTPFAEELEQATRREKRPTSTGRTERIVYIHLPDTAKGFLASLKAKRRWEVRRARERLSEGHAARFFVWEDAERLDAAVELLAQLHRKRWQSSGGSESFATPQYMEFHRAIIGSCFARGWLRLYCLEIDGQMAAMSYCYRFRNAVFVMQNGFDPAFSALRPGTVLLSYAIEHAIGEGNRVYDFLRGEHNYKDHFTNGARETLYVAAFRRNLSALAYAVQPPFIPMQRNSLRAAAGRWLRKALRMKPAPC